MNLKEFSKAIGMSQTTVSRALSGYPEVKPETREKIMKLALEMGYHPNRSAAGLATGKAGAIGVSASDEKGEGAVRCVVDTLSAIKFPSPGSFASKVTVTIE